MQEDIGRRAARGCARGHEREPRRERVTTQTDVERPDVAGLFRSLATRTVGAARAAGATGHDADDALMEAVLRYLERDPSTVREPERWLPVVARREHVRRALRRAREAEVLAAYLRLLPAVTDDTADVAERSDDVARVRQVLARLPYEDRLRLVRAYVLDMPRNEMAAYEDVSDNTLVKRLARSRDAFRNYWQSVQLGVGTMWAWGFRRVRGTGDATVAALVAFTVLMGHPAAPNQPPSRTAPVAVVRGSTPKAPRHAAGPAPTRQAPAPPRAAVAPRQSRSARPAPSAERTVTAYGTYDLSCGGVQNGSSSGTAYDAHCVLTGSATTCVPAGGTTTAAPVACSLVLSGIPLDGAEVTGALAPLCIRPQTSVSTVRQARSVRSSLDAPGALRSLETLSMSVMEEAVSISVHVILWATPDGSGVPLGTLDVAFTIVAPCLGRSVTPLPLVANVSWSPRAG